MNAVLGGALVLAALAALFAAAREARSRKLVSAEYSRKLVHVGMGSICLTFPWLFGSPDPVLALAAVAAFALLAVRVIPLLQATFGCVLHGVQRRSYGEFAFIGGVAAAFVLAHGDELSYVIPVAVLTFADTVATLVGNRFGEHRFNTPDGTKSLEGSCAFLAVAIVCVAVPLTTAGSPGALSVALLTSVALMAIEAAAWSGLDNLAIPLLGGVLIRVLTAATAGGF
jgi:phytol kinase